MKRISREESRDQDTESMQTKRIPLNTLLLLKFSFVVGHSFSACLTLPAASTGVREEQKQELLEIFFHNKVTIYIRRGWPAAALEYNSHSMSS